MRPLWACIDDALMISAEHLRLESPVSLEAATVGDVMSHGVISCPAEAPLRAVAQMMASFGVHAVFVFEYVHDQDAVPQRWSVVSDLDLVAATRLDVDTLTAGATAVTPLVNVEPDWSVEEAGSLMAQYGIAHLAVTEPGTRRPIGVISTLDIARAVAAGRAS